MIFAEIVGTVVSAKSDEGIKGKKTLLVQVCNQKGKTRERFIVAVDLVGSGIGEMVIIAQGSSSRQTEETYEKPIDAVIIGIVDSVSENNKLVFCK
jgi:microcompartment protein CcmK/EutM